MSPEEQIALAIECGVEIKEAEESREDDSQDWIIFYPLELAAYTATVEAKERERCAKECEKHNPSPDQWSDDIEYTEKRIALACANSIRSL